MLQGRLDLKDLKDRLDQLELLLQVISYFLFKETQEQAEVLKWALEIY
ncbi:hypothetical protein J2Z48_001239 [Croceifilum oryzae]|uniref:Uncharacterized protein n=1 Tax=Croceifilum oryzae TaxID=1553429 RepID=A0AAJ1THG9_9BACL|nr:hypothetical protein [Croceifilum oryzae]MDQ0417067.1 hypothetical protein [Croceifilum oryzae]